MVLEQYNSDIQYMNPDSYLITKKINSQWIVDLNVKAKTLQRLENAIEKNLLMVSLAKIS